MVIRQRLTMIALGAGLVAASALVAVAEPALGVAVFDDRVSGEFRRRLNVEVDFDQVWLGRDGALARHRDALDVLRARRAVPHEILGPSRPGSAEEGQEEHRRREYRLTHSKPSS